MRSLRRQRLFSVLLVVRNIPIEGFWCRDGSVFGVAAIRQWAHYQFQWSETIFLAIDAVLLMGFPHFAHVALQDSQDVQGGLEMTAQLER